MRLPPSLTTSRSGFSVRVDVATAASDPCRLFELLRRIPAAEVTQKQARLREVAQCVECGILVVPQLTTLASLGRNLQAPSCVVHLGRATELHRAQ